MLPLPVAVATRHMAGGPAALSDSRIWAMRSRYVPILGSAGGGLPLVAWGTGMGEDLLQRGPMHPRLSENLALAHAVLQDASPDLHPLFHFGVHSWPP